MLRLVGAGLVIVSGLSSSFAAPSPRAVNPVVASVVKYGNLLNPGVDRDSCNSVSWVGDGGPESVLWTCRDTEVLNSNGDPTLPLTVNTASYSGKPSGTGGLSLTGTKTTPFYPLESDECPSSGACSDGTRWVGWPNTGPVVTFSYGGFASGYAFLPRQHLSGLSVIGDTSYSLYHVFYQTSSGSALPTVTLDVSQFWTTSQVGYGSAASVVYNNYAYLYGPTPSGGLALARTPLGNLGTIEDKTKYEYLGYGNWLTSPPNLNDANISIPNLTSAQGTIYYSNKWSSFVWIGGDGYPNANFYISTAPAPEGPWTAKKLFYQGPVGTASGLNAYSAVAHPGLTDGTGNSIFISWTNTNVQADGTNIYVQPLVLITWA